jgi:hypothetical protein
VCGQQQDGSRWSSGRVKRTTRRRRRRRRRRCRCRCRYTATSSTQTHRHRHTRTQTQTDADGWAEQVNCWLVFPREGPPCDYQSASGQRRIKAGRAWGARSLLSEGWTARFKKQLGTAAKDTESRIQSTVTEAGRKAGGRRA